MKMTFDPLKPKLRDVKIAPIIFQTKNGKKKTLDQFIQPIKSFEIFLI